MAKSVIQLRNIGPGPDQVLPTQSFKTSEPDGATLIYKTETGPAAQEPISVYTLFRKAVEKFAEDPALLVKKGGNWRTWTFTEYFNESCIAAKAMIKLGLDRFHGVCIMGYNSPEWMIANFGAIFAGGFSVGVYTTNSPDACFSVADNCEAQILVVENEECLNKFLKVKERLPNVKAMVQWSGRPTAEGVLSWEEFLEMGMREEEGALEERLAAAAVNQCCTLIYTSGTTGPPKGVMLSQDQMTWTGQQYQAVFKTIERGEVVLSYLPFSHIAAQMGDIFNAFTCGTALYFAPPDALKGTLGKFLLEVRPTGFFAVPRIWEKIYEKMKEVAAEAGTVKRYLGSWAKGHALDYYKSMEAGRELSSFEEWKFYAAQSLVLGKVRAALGLGRAHNLVSGSAPIDPEILEYFFSLDLPIMEGYGLSESVSLCSMSLIEKGQFKIGSVGKVLPLTSVKIKHGAEHKEGEGEICIKGRNIFMGYLRMPLNTDEAIDNESWFHSGDLGRLDSEGFLFITGRLKELVITAGGENIPPLLIEEAVKKELPCLSNAMLVGDKRKYLTILLTFKSEMNLDTGDPLPELTASCQSWLKSRRCPAKTVPEAIAEVTANPKGTLAKEIQLGIERYNQQHAISNAQKVQRWTFLPHDFSLPTGELNNTLKLKRSFVLHKYKDVIESMYPVAAGGAAKATF